MADSILIFDTEGRCLRFALADPSRVDCPAAEFIGKSVYDIFLTDQADHLLQYIRQALCYRTENPFAFCGAPGGSMDKRKLTGTRNPSRSAYWIARSPI